MSRAISALRLSPVMFELRARPYPPREVYQQYLAQSDVFIGLYWQRYGQLAPARRSPAWRRSSSCPARSRLLYVKTPAPDLEPRLAALLDRIQAEASASYRHFRTPAELGRLVRDDLAVLLSERFAAAGRRRPRLRHRPGTRARCRWARRRCWGGSGPSGVAALVERPGVRLVTLTGPGGVGKTRLAVAAGERLRGRFGAGIVFVPLDSVTDPGQVLAAITRAAGADPADASAPVEALAETFGDGTWLLVRDNLRTGGPGRPRHRRVAGPVPGAGDHGYQPHGAGLRAEWEYPVPAARPARTARPGWRPHWTRWGPARWTCPSGSAPCGPRCSRA